MVPDWVLIGTALLWTLLFYFANRRSERKKWMEQASEREYAQWEKDHGIHQVRRRDE